MHVTWENKTIRFFNAYIDLLIEMQKVFFLFRAFPFQNSTLSWCCDRLYNCWRGDTRCVFWTILIKSSVRCIAWGRHHFEDDADQRFLGGLKGMRAIIWTKVYAKVTSMVSRRVSLSVAYCYAMSFRSIDYEADISSSCMSSQHHS